MRFATPPIAMIIKPAIHLLTQVSFTLLVCVSVAYGQSPKTGPDPRINRILPRIEKYKAPPYPETAYVSRETYDYRIQSRRPVPPTLTDVFICDIWQRVTMELKLAIRPDQVSEETVNQAINVYLKTGWSDIAGYRPWTHWNFIRKLEKAERDELAREITPT